MALVSRKAAFDVGREQSELLAGLHVSAKSVERQAERKKASRHTFAK